MDEKRLIRGICYCCSTGWRLWSQCKQCIKNQNLPKFEWWFVHLRLSVILYVNWCLGESFYLIYLDDVLIFSKTGSDHVKHVGHHIGLGHASPREQKVQALINFPCPTNRKGVQRFLGLAGYFRRLIPQYSESTCALTDLLKKNSKFVWAEACEKAFQD